MIKQLCEQMSISIAELSRRIGQSPQNFNKKLKRETVALDELITIADALNIKYEQAFTLPDGTQIKTGNGSRIGGSMKDKKDFKFEGRAEKYDDEFEGKLSEKFYTLVVDNVVLEQGYRILDYGCGTGTILKRLSEKCDIDGCGIDAEEKMIDVAREKCPQMEIQMCSCDATPYDDNSFDAIIACMAYHHFPDKSAFAKEASRLLKQGGRLYVAEPKFPLPIRKAINTALAIHKINGEFFKADEIAANFSDFGFKLIDTKSDSYAQIVILERS